MLSNENKQLIIDDVNARVSPYFAQNVSNRFIRGTSQDYWTVVPHEAILLKNGRSEVLNEEIDLLQYVNLDVDNNPTEYARVARLGDRYVYKGVLSVLVGGGENKDFLNPKLVSLLLAMYESLYAGDPTSTYLLLRQISAEKHNQISRNILDVKQPVRHGTIKPYAL